MIEVSGSRSIPLSNGSRSGRPENMWIRIRNTAGDNRLTNSPLWLGKLEMGKEMTTKIQLCPPPKPFTRTKEFEVVSRNLDTTLTLKVPIS